MIKLEKTNESVNCKNECKVANLNTYKAWLHEMRKLGFKGNFLLGGSIALKEVYKLYGEDKECHDIDAMYVMKAEDCPRESAMFACLMASQYKDPAYEHTSSQRADFRITGYPKANVWVRVLKPSTSLPITDYIEYDYIMVETLDVILKEKAKCGRPKDINDFMKIHINMMDLFSKLYSLTLLVGGLTF